MKGFLARYTKINKRNSVTNQQATMFLAKKESDKTNEDSEVETEYETVEMEIKPAHIVCPDCGGITIEGLDYCHKCGGELKPSD